MVATMLKLTEENKRKLDELARQTGKTPDDLANEAIGRLTLETPVGPKEPDWKAAWRQAAGMWKDRDDIPELMAQLRREWNRVEPPENPEPL
jgi:predicted transcriptional regulator